MKAKKWPLMTWDSSPDWCVPLSESTTVCLTVEERHAGEPHGPEHMKARFFYLAQTGETPPIRTGLPGKHLLLTEAEARALVPYLLESFDTFDTDDASAAGAAKRKAATVPARRKPGKRTRPKRRGARKR